MSEKHDQEQVTRGAVKEVLSPYARAYNVSAIDKLPAVEIKLPPKARAWDEFKKWATYHNLYMQTPSKIQEKMDKLLAHEEQIFGKPSGKVGE